jgi:hypothetical protein
MDQLNFNFDDPRSIQAKFEEYHRKRPEVYQQLIGLVFDKYRNGRKFYGIGALFEELRWYFRIEKREEDFKLNNNYRSRYVRKLIDEFPELEDFFELRELRAE